MAGTKRKSTKSNARTTNKRSKAKTKSSKAHVKKETDDESDVFYVEKIVDARKKKDGVWEYRVRWKGYAPRHDTWEPLQHIGEHFVGKALELRETKDPEFKKQQEKIWKQQDDIFNQLEEAENEAASANGGEGNLGNNDQQDTGVESWKDSDRAQVKFREVERINVNDDNAHERVTEAREFGIPICLTGHSGWAQFAKPWLKLVDAKPTSQEKADDSQPPSLVKTVSKSPIEKTASPSPSIVQANDPQPPSVVNTTHHVEVSSSAIEEPASSSLSIVQANDSQPPSIVKATHAEISKSAIEEADSSSPSIVQANDSQPPSIVNTTHHVDISKSTTEETTSSSPSIVEAFHDNGDAQLDGNGDAQLDGNDTDQLADQHCNLKPPPVATVIATGTARSHVSDTSSRQSPSLTCGNSPVAEPESTSDWLNLTTQEWQVDVQKMTEDVGSEYIPYVTKGYNAEDPLGRQPLLLSKFLENCWPSDTTDAESDAKKIRRLYLHQWQFPLSEESFAKLCGENCHRPLPDDILGEDLLAYWHDNKVNPYQYIFMGREETMSRLHKDAGGMDITIAPIVGRKEVHMVHRSDGISCFSHLEANLDKINLQKNPLMPFARIYKTTVNPGEILLMPQGTYHQCRNVTPCLSYSRFHLDSVNLRGFYESMIDRDSTETEHEVVIWNATHALFPEIDKHTAGVRKLRKKSPDDVPTPAHIARKVEALRSLRNVCRAISTRYEQGLTRSETHDGQGEAGEQLSWAAEEAKRWATLLVDVDGTLHDFRYRNKESTPTFRPRGGTQNAPSHSSGSSSAVAKLPLETALANLPLAVENAKLCVGNRVEAKFHGRVVDGEIKKVEMAKHMAMCQFEGLPSVFDEFLPFEWLRTPVPGGSKTVMPLEAVRPGKVIVYPIGNVDYRGNVKWCTKDDFVYVCLKIGEVSYDRWLPHSSILASTKE